MKDFAVWLSTTAPSVFIQSNSGWVVPIIQSIHIVAIAVVVGSILMLNLRILGWAGTDRTLRQTHSRFSPWQSWGIAVLLVTGLLMLVGEPVREIVSFSFWAKMVLILAGSAAAMVFERALGRHEAAWDAQGGAAKGLEPLAVATLCIWLLVIVMGRLIAYDHLWGPLSPAARV